jgi:sugar phosphate isomerase/epimerase
MADQQSGGLTRRRFLQASAAGAAVGLAAAPAPAQDAPQESRTDPFGGFIVGVQSYTFRNFNLEQALQRIHDLGLHYVELTRGHLPSTSTPAQIRAALNLCHRFQITPVAYGVESFTANHDANRRLFDFAHALGIRTLSADPTPDSFDSLDRLTAEYNISIGIHPHGPQGRNLHRWYSAEVIMEAVRNHDRLIGTCLDTGHLIRAAQPPFNRRLDPAAQVRVMGSRNFGMHLKDHDNQAQPPRDVVFGRGALNVLEVLRALRAAHFHGYLSIEYEANPDNPSPDVRACLDVFRDAVRRLG